MGRGEMQTRVGVRARIATALLALALCLPAVLGFGDPAIAQDTAPQTSVCSKAEFESVVDEAAAALRDLNAKNRPTFQEKLRKLKEKRGWDNDKFLVEAAPIVKDERIEDYEGKTNGLLAKISSMGEEGSAAKVPDCAMLTELHAHMKALIDTQVEKWAYMFERLEAELAK